MRKTIKLGIALNILLVLTIFILIVVSLTSKPEQEQSVPKKEEVIIDTIPPVIELTGTDMTLEQNTIYNEPGYKATDNIDQDITDKVKITTNLDITKVGTYNIEYQVTDSSNNTTKVIRIINIVKKTIERQTKYSTTKTDNQEINNYIKTINDYLKPYKVSVGYLNLDNGFTYIYNGNKEYFGASLIKTIDAMYIYENNLNNNKNTNLVNKAISVSNNSAHASLVKEIGTKKLKKYIKNISGREPYCNSRFFCNTTVHDQLSYWIYLYNLIENHQDGQELKSFFINNLGNHLSYTQKYDNLHKYGASDTYYHDVGMFYTDTNPYIVVVLTNEVGTYPKKIKYLIRPISKKINKLNSLVEKNY